MCRRQHMLGSEIGAFMRKTLLLATALSTTIMFLVPGIASGQSDFDWDGFYAGISGGMASGSGSLEVTYLAPPTTNTLELTGLGGLLTATVGYNVQNGVIVVGGEADASALNLNEGFEDSYADIDAALDSLLTLRGRLGVAGGRFLFYGTAGLALGQARFNANLDDPIGGPVTDASASGWVAGGVAGMGLEVAVNDNVSLKAEGMVYRLSELNGSGDDGKYLYDASYKPAGVVLRGGANFHF